jgi:hypothetical protein
MFRTIRAIAAPAALALILTPIAARAQDTQTPQTSQPSYQGGVPAGPSTETPPPPPLAENRKPHLLIGINAGVFVPSSGKARNRFGNAWWSAGIGVGAIPKATGRGSFGLDLRTKYQSASNDRHVFVGSLGAEYRRRFDPNDNAAQQQYIPYYGVSVDAIFTDISSPQDNVHSGINTTAGASVFVGTTIGQQEFLTLRYEAMPDVKGFNFSGLSLTAGVRFY